MSYRGRLVIAAVSVQRANEEGEDEVKKILDGLGDVFSPSGPPVFLIAIIAFLVAMLATIYLESILS